MFEFLNSVMAVLDARILFDFTVELLHDFGVHFLDLFFELGYLIVDRDEFSFELIELKLMNVLDFLHLISGFEVVDDLCLFLLNAELLILEFVDKGESLLVVENDIMVEFFDLISGLNDEVFEIDGPLFVPFDFLLDFPHPRELGLLSELFGV